MSRAPASPSNRPGAPRPHPWQGAAVSPTRAERVRAAMAKLADEVEQAEASASPDPAFESVVVGRIVGTALRRVEKDFQNE